MSFLTATPERHRPPAGSVMTVAATPVAPGRTTLAADLAPAPASMAPKAPAW